MLTNDCHHFLNGLIADTILLCFTVNHIAGRGSRHAGEPGDFIQFHNCPSKKEKKSMALSRLWLNILTSKRRIAFTATAFVRVVGGLRKKKPGFGYRAERGEPFAQLTHDFIAAREANNARARNFNNFCYIPDGGRGTHPAYRSFRQAAQYI